MPRTIRTSPTIRVVEGMLQSYRERLRRSGRGFGDQDGNCGRDCLALTPSRDSLPPALLSQQGSLLSRSCYFSASTGFRSVPIDSMVQVERSPGLKYTGVARAVPTPAGLPVEIRSPGCSVI